MMLSQEEIDAAVGLCGNTYASHESVREEIGRAMSILHGLENDPASCLSPDGRHFMDAAIHHAHRSELLHKTVIKIVLILSMRLKDSAAEGRTDSGVAYVEWVKGARSELGYKADFPTIRGGKKIYNDKPHTTADLSDEQIALLLAKKRKKRRKSTAQEIEVTV